MAYISVLRPIHGWCNTSGLAIECTTACGVEGDVFDRPTSITCLDWALEGFCVDVRHNIFFLWGILALPVFITQILSLKKCRSFRPSGLTFFHNYVITGLFSCFVSGAFCAAKANGAVFPVIPLIVAPLLHMIAWAVMFLACNVSCIPGAKTRPRFVCQAFGAPLLSYSDLLAKIAAIRRCPPIVELTHTIFVSGPRDEPGSTHTQTERQPYCSWEERCEEIQMPPNATIVLIVKSRVEFTAGMRMVLQQRMDTAQWGIQVVGPYPTSMTRGIRYSIDEKGEVFMSTPTEGLSCFPSFARSYFGRFVYGLLAFIGLHSIYEAIFCASVTPLTLETEKWVSNTDEFHCPAYMMDAAAPTIVRPNWML
jgi:hypothetical protein